MPYIDAKVTISLSPEQKEDMKCEFGKLIEILNKTERYLMVGIDDNADLWFGGIKLECGAYIAVSLLGNASPELYDKMTGGICNMLQDKFGISGDDVYVTYHPIRDWGWSGHNF
ncbi:MAG: hypothetical protein IKH92_09840 [Clostridiales bacterium]|nr:hypothetical protein [Clostridiales bacterium]